MHLAVALSFAAIQQFTNVGGVQVPNLSGFTETAKFGDWDLDGDLDLVYANGGDAGNQQSRLLVNQGLAQAGTIGFYADVTATQLLPNLVMSSRDVQPVDIDNDGDLDFHFANHSTNAIQSNVWFVNQGGLQGGSAGVFQMDMTRYVGLGQSGSSIPAGQLIVLGAFAGGFKDWSCQTDFADVDLDGDLDMYHSSYGSGFSGSVMSRLFLNGGGALGQFREYNPSNAVSGNPDLPSGNAAGFLEGVQASNTTDATGAFHDITNIALDLDFADLDGDFDLDVFAESRDTRSRFYRSRWFENGGSLGSEGAGTRLYRDVTGLWGTNLTNADANYDAELHDLDFDGDVDGYFLNYFGGTSDGFALNDGTGAFGILQPLPLSALDEQEVDFHDFDHDGDVDPFISGFSGVDRFYRNMFAETGRVAPIVVTIAPTTQNHSLAADVGDMDNDGDADLVFAQDQNISEILLKNNLDLPDPIAPRLRFISQLSAGTANSTPRVVLARASDNVNLENFRSATGEIHFTLDGVFHSYPARWAGGDVWRATVPGYWFGTIAYTMTVADRVGNTGTSPTKSVAIASAGLANYGTATQGCGTVPHLAANSAPASGNLEFAFRVSGAASGATGVVFVGDKIGNGSDSLGFGVAVWVDIAGSTTLDAVPFAADAAGNQTIPYPIDPHVSIVGMKFYSQAILTNGACIPPDHGATQGLELTIQP